MRGILQDCNESPLREIPLCGTELGKGAVRQIPRMWGRDKVNSQVDYRKAAIFSGSFGTTIGWLPKVGRIRSPSGASSLPVW